MHAAQRKPETRCASFPAKNIAERATVQATYIPAWASLPLQTQLTVNQPGDAYEVEADQLADQVMRMPEPQVQRCACGGDPGPDGECAACRARRLAVQRKSARTGQTAGNAPASVHRTLNRGGQPLDRGIQHSMESRFGTDFSDVRVHTDSQAAQSAQDINARAYTVGSDVVFGPGQYAPGTNSGDRLIAHELVHTMQQGASAGMVQRNPDLPEVDVSSIPESWRRTPLPMSEGSDVYVYRGFARNAESHAATVVREGEIGGILSRRLDTAHDAIFNQVGRDPVLSGPQRAGVVRVRIPAALWDELVRTNSISERGGYPGFSRQISSTEIRVNSVEAAQAINNLPNDILPPDPYYDFRPGTTRPPRPQSEPEVTPPPERTTTPERAGGTRGGGSTPEAPNITDYNVRSQFRVLNSQEIPGNRFVYEVEVTLGDGLDNLNAEIRTRGGRPLPQRLIVRLTTDADGALLAAESSTGEANALIEGLARQLLRSAPAAEGAGGGAAGAARGASRLVRGVAWAGMALFAAVSVYRMATTDDRTREGAMIAGGFVAGMGSTYLICNLLLGIETLGWSLLLCGIPAGAVGGLAGEAAARVAYEEATIDDDEIRSWVGRQSAEALAAISTSERLRMIFSLMKGWVSDEDVTTIRRLLDTIRTRAEMSLIERFLRPQLIELSSIGQRTQIRVSLARRIE